MLHIRRVRIVIFCLSLMLVLLGCVVRIPSKGMALPAQVSGKTGVLLLRVTGPLVEQYDASLSLKNQLKESGGTLVRQLLTTLEYANKDKSIEIIALSLSKMQPSSMPAVVELYKALKQSKKAGKTIYAYSENYTMSSFLLASVADKIWLDPFGEVGLNGLAISVPSFKRAMDKYGLDAYIVRAGRFKSAVEPFTLYEMSPDVRAEMNEILNSQWANYLQLVTESGRFNTQLISSYTANRPSLLSATGGDGAKLALQQKLVDHVGSSNDFRAALKEVGHDGWMEHVQYLSQVSQKASQTRKFNTPYVTVLYAVGAITRHGGERGEMNAEALASQIYTAKENPKTKAIVIRVDSPGGEVFASEMIAREIAQAREKMPVVISMGGTAASGGYWLSLAGSEIWADPSTITGSIGVFSMLINASGLLSNQGITQETLKTHPQAGGLSAFGNAPNAVQMQMAQSGIDFVYQKFLQKMVEAKKAPNLQQADLLAQGRVYTGTQALKLGLVDKLGTLDDALKRAAELAELREYDVVVYSPQQTLLARLIALLRERSKIFSLGEFFGGFYGYVPEQETQKIKTYALNSFVVILP